MSGVESSDEWNERQAKNLELEQCCRDNPLVALGNPRDILAILREGSDRKTYPQWWSICRQAADEIFFLRFLESKCQIELAQVEHERDEARLQTRRILNEIDYRIEHGAESNGHLEAIRNLFKEETDGK